MTAPATRPKQYRQTQAPLKFTPPSDLEAEQSTLGAMLIEPEALHTGRSILKASDFHSDINRSIFEALCTLNDAGTPADLITIQAELKVQGRLESVGGIAYLALLYDRVPTAVNIAHYAMIVKKFSDQRATIDASLTAITKSLQVETVDELAVVQNELMDALGKTGYQDTQSSDDIRDILMSDYLESEERAVKGKPTGITTLFAKLNTITGGLQQSDMIVIAGETSGGKTGLALSIAAHHALNGGSPGIFSQEMSKTQNYRRIVSALAKIEMQRLNAQDLSDAEIERSAAADTLIYEMKMRINDRAAHTPASMMAVARSWHKKQPLTLIVIDYLQLMRPNKPTGHEPTDIAEVSHSIKSLAKEFDVPVIALAQFSRDSEKNRGKRRTMFDVKGSSSIEQDADLFVVIYDEVYGMEHQQKRSISPYKKRAIELNIEKNRHGPTGTVMVGYTPAYAQFEEWA